MPFGLNDNHQQQQIRDERDPTEISLKFVKTKR